jgi:hypothetical protein
MHIGDEGLGAARFEAHRPAEQLRQCRRRELVGIDVQLDAEAAAHVAADDAHAMLGDAEQLREHVVHLVRHLMRLENAERVVDRIVVGDDDARLERHAGMAVEAKAALDDDLALPHLGADIGFAERAIERAIVAERRMHETGALFQRRQGVGYGRQRLPLHLDRLDRVFGGGVRFRDDGSGGLALPARHAIRERRLRRRDMVRRIRHRGPHRPADAGEIGRGGDT